MSRTCILFLSAFALCVATIAVADEPSSAREEAIAALRASGIKVELNEGTPEKPVKRVFCGCHHCTAPQLQQLKLVNDVTLMNLRLGDVTDEDMAHLRALTKLDTLIIHNSKFADEFLAHVAALPEVRRLYLSHLGVSDAGLKHLAGMTQLEQLSVDGKGITDSGLESLAKLTNLKSLSLRGTSVTEKGLESLRAALPNTTISQ